MADLSRRDAAVTWHPYTQHGTDNDPLPIVGAEGSWLELADGRRLFDAISSWWTCLHGHGEASLVEAMHRQAARLDHVLFAGATHEPAVALAERLLDVAPDGLSRVFYSDNGSTAVEVALKMILQSWQHRGERQREVFVALAGGYHGDTCGAMSVGDPDPFFTPYRSMLFDVRRIPIDLDTLATTLDELGGRAAGLIVEPLVQGAGGMRMYDEATLRGVADVCQARGVPWIADEVMTGFGRTGSLFACSRAGVTPDLMCLSKGLTGGMLPLAATLAREPMFETFVSGDRGKMFFHGHSFTANPIACAVALASLERVLARAVPAHLDAVGQAIEGALIETLPPEVATAPRRTGGIVAVDLFGTDDTTYLSSVSARIRSLALEHDVLLRPLGPVVYALPPASTTIDEAHGLGHTIGRIVAAASQTPPGPLGP